MSAVYPFRALRPEPTAAAAVASVPYDVVSTEEARALVVGRPLDFLRVTRAEVDLPVDADPHGAATYAQALRNFEELKRAAPFVMEDEPSLYCYRLRMGTHEQTGVAGCFSVDEYDRGLIRKHETTRPDKEDDRTRHIVELRAQTGLLFLVHRSVESVETATRAACASSPLFDFVAADGVTHTVWRATGAERDALVAAFAEVDVLYIADGHHRAASAARARRALRGSNEAARMVGVAFPDRQVQVLSYNRAVKDLAGATPTEFLSALRAVGQLGEGSPVPAQPDVVSVYIGGRWHSLRLPRPSEGAARSDALAGGRLQQLVLGPLLGVNDPRTDARIEFIGGIRGPEELERRVQEGHAAVAFSMPPVDVADLMAIADEGGIMPPKSTWFEPKLRDGLLVHLV